MKDKPTRRYGQRIDPILRGYPRKNYYSYVPIHVMRDEANVPYEAHVLYRGTYHQHRGRIDDFIDRFRLQRTEILVGWKIETDRPHLDLHRYFPGRIDLMLREFGQDVPMGAISCEELLHAFAAAAAWIDELHRQFDVSLSVSQAHFASRLIRKSLEGKSLRPLSIQQGEYAYNAYFGGRQSTAWRGLLEGPIYKYDQKSAYPNAIRNLTDAPIERSRHLDERGIYYVDVDVRFPSLPHRTRHGLTYPIGRWTGYYTGLDLLAMETAGMGTIDRIRFGWCQQEGGDRVFRSAIDRLLDGRHQSSSRLKGHFFKRAACSIYGGFIASYDGHCGSLYHPWFAAITTARVRSRLLEYGRRIISTQTDAVWSWENRLPSDEWQLECTAKKLVLFRAGLYIPYRQGEGEDIPIWDQMRTHGYPGVCKPALERRLSRGCRVYSMDLHYRYDRLRSDSKEYFFNAERGTPYTIEEV